MTTAFPKVAGYNGTFAGSPVTLNVQADYGFVAGEVLVTGSAALTLTLPNGNQLVVPVGVVLTLAGPINTAVVSGTSGQTYTVYFGENPGSFTAAIAGGGGGGGGGASNLAPYLTDDITQFPYLPNSVPIRGFSNHLAFTAVPGSGAGFEVNSDDAVLVSAVNDIRLETFGNGASAVLRSAALNGGASLQVGTGPSSKIMELTLGGIACDSLELKLVADGTAANSAATVQQIVDRIRWAGTTCATTGGGTKYIPLGFDAASTTPFNLALALAGTVKSFSLRCTRNNCTEDTQYNLMHVAVPNPPVSIGTLTVVAGSSGVGFQTIPLAVAVTDGDELFVEAVSPVAETTDVQTVLCVAELSIV